LRVYYHQAFREIEGRDRGVLFTKPIIDEPERPVRLAIARFGTQRR
jgi:hypothetical protein